ncbi:hypothetical protein RS130_09950 [Paraglaciecola aquimarina]|uniref:Uncharacterized protein n=1 Tax=Paraglaciecola aquimarina TaxID=1235557 RepID=A0ABU3SW36_9ALTE|nr:hypothetical protein [Paraglaciecola aquimarina]MDU0354215.1 hypothetical protein [Paraglaciecola aquimarina]
MQPIEEENTLDLGAQAFVKQSFQFWSLQFSGWIGYALVVFIAIIRPQLDSPSFNFSGQMLNLFVEVSSGFVLSYLQWLFIRKIVHLPLKKTLFLSFFSAGVLGIVFNVIKLASYKTVVYNQAWHEQWSMLEFGGWFLFSLSAMFVWTAIFLLCCTILSCKKSTRCYCWHKPLLKMRSYKCCVIN